MHATGRMAKNVREKNPLVDFKSVLMLLLQPVLFRELRLTWNDARRHGRRIAYKLLDALELGQVVREPPIDGFGMASEKSFACLAIALQNCRGGRDFRRRARRLLRQMRHKLGANPPLPPEIVGIAPEVASDRVISA